MNIWDIKLYNKNELSIKNAQTSFLTFLKKNLPLMREVARRSRDGRREKILCLSHFSLPQSRFTRQLPRQRELLYDINYAFFAFLLV